MHEFRSSGKRRFGRILASAVCVTALTAPVALAATARQGNLQVIKSKEDAFYNYDFNSRTVSRNNVDWPVTLLFWNNAEIDKVKSAFRVAFPFSGSQKYARLDDGPGDGEWDSDGGRKTILCSNPVQGSNSRHFRIYATSNDDRMYNTTWGFYVFGTTHIDHNECYPPDRYFGYSEDSEKYVTLFARDIYGPSRVNADSLNFGNQEPFRREGNHIWSNDGLATTVKVP